MVKPELHYPSQLATTDPSSLVETLMLAAPLVPSANPATPCPGFGTSARTWYPELASQEIVSPTRATPG
jgi:hypothetical protein